MKPMAMLSVMMINWQQWPDDWYDCDNDADDYDDVWFNDANKNANELSTNDHDEYRNNNGTYAYSVYDIHGHNDIDNYFYG